MSQPQFVPINFRDQRPSLELVQTQLKIRADRVRVEGVQQENLASVGDYKSCF
jgi:hypothetical protein